MFLERYEIGELLADSGRNTVRRVRRVSDGARLVLKLPTREYPSVRELRRLEFEYDLLCKLRSPGVIAAVDIERESGRIALVLEDFGGERLPARPGQGMDLDVFFPLAAAIAGSLGQVHARNVIHKDLNPRNILMNPATRQVKLIDFSLASELRRERLDVTPHTQLEGTLPYISPEQTGRMNRDLDYRTDYYSLGATFFELLTGSLPFSAPDVLGFIHCHLSKPVPSPRDYQSSIPEGLAALVMKLLSKSPDDRYQSAKGLLGDLAECQRVWQSTREIPSFALGRHDLSERFQVSQELLSRELPARTLLTTFEEAARGPARLLLIAGYSGIGKSTLVSEIHKPVVEQRAHFISGKFEQLERNLPYGALVQALRAFARQVLTEPERQLSARRQRLGEALGKDAAVLIALVPELGQVMGPQPAVAELPARDAQSRLSRLFRDFIRAIASAEHPLVIFLDDLQWTDAATPQLLLHLLGDDQLKHVFFIGAYRDNEVGQGHLLWSAIDELSAKRPDVLSQLWLTPLPEAAVRQLVASTLHADAAACASFARLIFAKTAGNPFFVHELLNLLYREGAIELSPDGGAWTWHDDRVARAAVSDNVVELMVRRLRGLPPETLSALCIGACLGKEFELGQVARISGKTAGALSAALWPAVEQQLLSPKGNAYQLVRRDGGDDGLGVGELAVVYQFPHDRVVEAAYSLIEETERGKLHLQIGRLLKDAIAEPERGARVFDFIDHLNRGRALLETSAERVELMQLNMLGAQKARRSAAYATAISLLENCQRLLSAAEWQSQVESQFECARMRIECIFLSGQVELAARECEALFGAAPHRVQRVAAFCLKAAILEQQSHLGEAVATIRQGLLELGVELPDAPEAIEREIGAGIGKMLAHLDRTAIEDLVNLPRVSDPERAAAMELLFQLIPAASQINPPQFILAELMLFDLALTHGTVAASAKNFMDCGIVLGAMLNDYERAYRMGKVAFRLLERQMPTPLESAVNFVFGCFISHWGAHHQEGLDALARGFQRGVELGDVLHASYSVVHRCKSYLFAGKELGECQAQTDRALAYTLETGAVGHVAVPRILARALGQLRDKDQGSPSQLPDADFISEIRSTENGHFMLVLGQTQTLVQLVLGDLDAAVRWDELATQYIGVGNGAFPVPDYYLFGSLILGRKWRGAGTEERARITETLERHHATLLGFAKASPSNFAHKQLLVAAELARIGGATIDEVLRLHREVQQAAGKDFVHVRALAHEVLAEFWKDKGYPEFGRECLLEAYHLYRHWGAAAKLRRLEQEHGHWLRPAMQGAAHPLPSGTLATTTATASLAAASLDVASAIKATLAISSEVKPERLFHVLMQTIIENVGAEHGYLIVKEAESDELVVTSRASIQESQLAPQLPLALEGCDLLSQDLVRYVARTGETLVLDDAQKDEVYKKDAHVAANSVKSLLCMPLLNQGQLLAVLYVENNAVARAFTPARLLFLRVIAGQAAVSIANANLYERLELEVQDRTEQLAEQSREVSAMLNSLEQGVFTIDEQLSIQPRYSARLEELLDDTDLSGRDCIEVLFRDSNVSAAALINMRAGLDFCFGAPVMFAMANQGHWVREFHRELGPGAQTRNFEVDWTLIADADGAVSRILVAVRDVTLLRQMSAKVAQHARELDVVGQILDAGVEAFLRFCASAQLLLAEARQLLQSGVDLTSTRARVFRGLHTIKGNARLLGFSHLAGTVHLAESSFDSGASAPEGGGELARMQSGVEAVRSGIEEYEQVYQRKLGDVLREPERKSAEIWGAIAARVSDAETGSLGAAEALAAISELLRRGGAVSLRQLVKSAGRLLPVLAQELGKVAPRVELGDRANIWLTQAWSEALKSSLIHVFQNAMDHGIEADDERARKQKPRQGQLHVRTSTSSRGTTLRIADDGRGLDLAALRGAAGEPDESEAESALRIFGAGVSTAERVTQISGRGVGLDAVRASVRELGGEVSVVLTGPADGGFCPFELVFELPPDAVLGDAQRPSRPPSVPPGRSEYHAHASRQ
jgi:predicted ATPase/GAF domain-containing protein/HPt (histidine-containing phosphotransfer) domain-containing protein